MEVEIVGDPEGGHPLWVREAWKGLILPVSSVLAKKGGKTVQVSVFPIGILDDSSLDAKPEYLGFGVLLGDALAVLRAAGKKEAAEYWTNMYLGGRAEGRGDIMTLFFSVDVCRQR